MCYVFKAGDFKIAIDCHKLRLSNAKELGYKIGEGAAYSNLGNSFQSLRDFKQAIPHNHKLHLNISEDLRDKATIGQACEGIGIVYQSLGDLKKSHRIPQCKSINKLIHFYELDLSVANELGDKWSSEGAAYENLGNGYGSLGNFKPSIHYHNL